MLKEIIFFRFISFERNLIISFFYLCDRYPQKKGIEYIRNMYRECAGKY